jgi:dipeptidyl aminopeptidase/acylaminoacyl peptidase
MRSRCIETAFRALVVAGLIFLAALPMNAGAQVRTPPPLSEYGELPAIESARLSYSGNRIAVITTINDLRSLLVIEIGKGAIKQITLGEMKVRNIHWIGDDRVLMVSSQTEKLVGFATDKVEFYSAQVIPVGDVGEIGIIFNKNRGIVNAIFGEYGIRQIDGRWYGFFGGIKLSAGGSGRGAGGYVFNHGRPYLYRVDLEDFSVREVAIAAREGHRASWLIDAEGNVAATFEINLTTGGWQLRGKNNRQISKGENPLARIGLIGLGFGGESIILSDSGPEETQSFEVPVTGGELAPFLEDVEVESIYFERRTGELTGSVESGATPKPVFRDSNASAAAAKVLDAFPQKDMGMSNWTEDFTKVIVRTSDSQDSGSWYWVDVPNLRAEAIGYERLQIEPEQVGPISTFAYTASDGMPMDGILTLPPGREARNLPAIIMPHGGPHAHDIEGFDWWAQAYASRGYAVFQPNFRGSTNRDQQFLRAGYGEWGRKMQTDKSDGLNALVDKEIIDPKRVCIVGASYGGYAALAGVTLQQGLYRCAVAVAPVSDLNDIFNEDTTASGDAATARASLLRQLGSRRDWSAVSPKRAAAQADAPIMLIHGKDDIVVPYRHSTRMASALRSAGKPYELVTLDGEDHWLSRSQTRRAMLEAAVRFVEQHNPAS